MTTANDMPLPNPRGSLERLPEMDDEQFRRWAALLQERTGMVVRHERRSFLATGVGLRMRELGYDEYQAYYDYLTASSAGKVEWTDRKSTRLNSSHVAISYAVFCLKKNR